MEIAFLVVFEILNMILFFLDTLKLAILVRIRTN